MNSDERSILYRAVFPRVTAVERRGKMVRAADLRGEKLLIDGYNCLITLENAMADKPLVIGDDGFVRDIGRVFRKFRPSSRTERAWGLISRVLVSYPPSFTLIFLDMPYSKSGELSVLINHWIEKDDIQGHCRTSRNTERSIAKMEGIKASADSVIIDNSDRVFDLAGHVIRRILRIRPIRI
jgi:hypothetical protein